MIEFELDGRPIEAEPGMTVLQATKASGIHIPHLCYHPMFSVSGCCRICVVEVEGGPKLLAACNTPVTPGLKVQTESDRVVRARREILHLYLANYPVDELFSEPASANKLRTYCEKYGVTSSQYAGGEVRHYETDGDNPFFERNLDKCILCERCVRMCDEVVGAHVYDMAFRGFDAKIIAGMDTGLEDSPCIFCGNCITVCPTGALEPVARLGVSSTITSGAAASSEPAPGGRAGVQPRIDGVKEIPTICPYCGVGCAMALQVDRGRIVGCRPLDGPANRTLMCVKGRFGWDFAQHPDRLTTPLIRRHGRLEPASWDEALDRIASRLGSIREKNSPDAICGISSSKCTNEENYLMQKLMRAAIGTNNIDNSARLCHASTVTGLSAAFGSGAATNTIAELETAGVILISGSNTLEAHPVIGFWVHRARARGAKIIVVDPRRTPMTDECYLHLQIAPGTDVPLYNAMMHVILDEGLEDREFIEKRTEGFADLEAVLVDYTPEYASRICGVDPDQIRLAARTYASSRRSTILYAMGMTQHTHGTDNVVTIANLAIITGNVGRPSTGVYPLRGQNNVQGACDMGCLPELYPGYQHVMRAGVREKFESAWSRKLSAEPGLTVMEMFNGALQGKIKAMYIIGENPMLSNPDLKSVRQAIDELEFLVVQDIFLTETAELADVVLPAATWAEKEGTFANTERRVQLIQKAVEPPGQARADWEILCEVASRLGYPMSYGSAAEIMDEIASVTPYYGGIAHDRLGTEGLQWPCPTKDHPGTVFLHHEKFSRGMGLIHRVEYRPPAEVPDDNYPFVLITGRIYYQYHTGSMSRRSEGLESVAPECFIEVHPRTAGELGIEQGELVRVATRRGEVEVKAVITERVGPKVLFMPFHYSEAAANWLTNPEIDEKAKIPELKYCAASLRPASARKEEFGCLAGRLT